MTRTKGAKSLPPDLRVAVAFLRESGMSGAEIANRGREADIVHLRDLAERQPTSTLRRFFERIADESGREPYVPRSGFDSVLHGDGQREDRAPDLELVRGGQGRTAEDVEGSAEWIFWLVATVVSALLGWWAVSHFGGAS